MDKGFYKVQMVADGEITVGYYEGDTIMMPWQIVGSDDIIERNELEVLKKINMDNDKSG